MKTKIKSEILRIKSKGAQYVDVRYFPNAETETIVFLQGNLKSNDKKTSTGIGVRVLADGAWGFAAASSTENLSAIFDSAFENAKIAGQRVTFPVQLAERTPITASYESPCEIDPLTIPLSEKINFLKKIDGQLNQPAVSQRISYLNFDKKEILFLDSDGADIEKTIHDIFATMIVIGVEKNGMSQRRSYNFGNNGQGTRGWESFQNPEMFENHTSRVVDELAQVLVAEECPKDTRSIILLPEIMFLQTHEVIGHALELDRILGYELSYAGGSFVRLEDFGNLKYGSEKLTVRADGTMPNSPGSFGFDDDGVPCQNYVLIEKGILKNAITSRQTITEANAKAGKTIFEKSGGSARASDFNRVPLERMTNINIDPGTDGTLDDIIANTEKGIVLDGARSWSIGSNREQFHFANEIGWLVENGEKKQVVKNPKYGGDTIPFWNSLSAVGNESTMQLVFVPNCGKGLPSQQMFLGHNVPICKFDNIEIGK